MKFYTKITKLTDQKTDWTYPQPFAHQPDLPDSGAPSYRLGSWARCGWKSWENHGENPLLHWMIPILKCFNFVGKYGKTWIHYGYMMLYGSSWFSNAFPCEHCLLGPNPPYSGDWFFLPFLKQKNREKTRVVTLWLWGVCVLPAKLTKP